MTIKESTNLTRTATIPCFLNQASIGKAEFVFVILRDLADRKGRVAWVPRKDLMLEKQHFQGDEIRARLTVSIKSKVDGVFEVCLRNRGNEEIIKVPKNIVATMNASDIIH